MKEQMSRLQQALLPLRTKLTNHPVYAAIQEVDQLHTFMKFHIYAVWDFMSLLKALQRDLTCTSVPWFPVGNANTRYLINEIVAGEESDVDETGERMSHYEMYLNAMTQCGAETSDFERFITALQSSDLNKAFESAGTPQAALCFVKYTFEVIASGRPHGIAAAFTFGREDLIPDLFYEIVRDLNQTFPEKVSKFHYYLERHIEVDGEHHSHLALQMVEELCGNDAVKWQEAEAAAITALEKRIALWDGILETVSASEVFLGRLL